MHAIEPEGVTTATLGDALAGSGVAEFLSQLDRHLVGLTPVKSRIRDIAALLLKEMQYQFDPAAKEVFVDYLKRRMALPHFANARSVRNALDRARLRRASRLLSTPSAQVTDDSLKTITAADLLASRAFSDAERSEP